MVQRLLLFVLLMGIPGYAFSWGQTGHRVIGAIAEKHLSENAQREIKEILDGKSLAWVSTYMDEIRSDDAFDHTHDWHWVTIPDGKTYAEADKNLEGDLVEAIGRMKEILKDESKPKEERAEALKFLVHLVGDLHQPLHVGNGDDRGGNMVKVEWFGRDSNLHRVWDSGMLASRDFAFNELSMELERMMSEEKVAKWSRGDVLDWAHEAMEYRTQVYDTGERERMGYEYTYENWDLLTEQLMKGGVRLAAVLNQILD